MLDRFHSWLKAMASLMPADPRLCGQQRSSEWSQLRDRYLAVNNTCRACGGTKGVVPHHIIPFWQRPDLELVWDNLVPLCEGRRTLNCHLWIGHCGDWKLYNHDPESYASFFRHMLISAKGRAA